MKNKINNLVKISLFLMLFCGIVFTGCDKEDYSPAMYDEYLDVVFPSDGELLDEESSLIIHKAFERIDKYVKSDNEKFYLMISSGSEINISERLYEHFEQRINYLNQQIDKDIISLQGKDIIYIGDDNVGNSSDELPELIRLKSGDTEEDENGDTEEGEDDFDYTGTDASVSWPNWYTMEVKLSHNVTNHALSTSAIIGLSLPEPKVSKIIAALCIISNDIYNSYGNGRGVTVTIRPTYNSYSFN